MNTLLQAEVEDMKVVALKIYQKQIQALKILKMNGIYSSASEALRAASWDLLAAILVPHTKGFQIKRILVKSDVENQFFSPTKSICGKFPLKMIAIIDWIISKHIYENRSEFFRTAISNFLISDAEIFSYYLKEEDQ